MQRVGSQAGFIRSARLAALIIGCLAVGNCSSGKLTDKTDSKWGVSASARVVEPGAPVPKGGGTYRVGKPYTVAGKTYAPAEDVNYHAEGLASWYGDDFHGRLTANGEVYDMQSITAAHPTLPIPSYVRVTNISNSRSIVVRVNDRGPYVGNRIIDLSSKTAQLLGFRSDGVAKVRVEYVGRAPIEGSDDRKLMATLRTGGERTPAPSEVRVAAARPSVTEPNETPVTTPMTMPMTKRSNAVSAPAERPATPTLSSSAAPAAVPAKIASAPLAAPDTKAAPGPKTSPVSAFAPVRYDSAAGFMSGRGIY